MKNKIAVSTLSAAVLTAFALSATNAHASFGTLPGNPANIYGGTGIPTTPSAYTVGTLGNNGDSVTIALSTTAHGASNPAPTTTADYVFNVGTGLNGGRSLWNYDYYVNSASGALSAYTFSITVLNVGNGLSVSYNPLNVLLGNNPSTPSSAGNSESLDFIAGALGYNANLNDTYDVTLTATDGTTTLSTSEEIIAGTGAAPVPEPTTIVAGSLMLLPFGIGALRKFRKSVA
jgi:hypothetical protein